MERIYLHPPEGGGFLVCRPGAIVLGAAVGHILPCRGTGVSAGEKSGRTPEPGRTEPGGTEARSVRKGENQIGSWIRIQDTTFLRKSFQKL